MTDGFGHRWSARTVVGPVAAAILAGSAAYAVQQDAFATTSVASSTPLPAQPAKDKSLTALQRAVHKQEQKLASMRSNLRQTEKAIKRTLAETRNVPSGSGSTWVPSSSSGSWSSSSGSTSSGGSGGTTSVAPAPQPTTQTTTGASGATVP